MTQSRNQYFATRASIRRYDPSREVDKEFLTRMLDLARMAPNTGNMQLYSVVVTTDAARLRALAAEGHFNQPAAAGAKAILTFCIDIHRFARWCELSGTTSSLGNLQGFTWAAIDTSIFAQQFVTLAEMEGLGTCYLGTTTYNPEPIARLLNLPSGVLPLISVSVGWPAESGDEKQRLPLESVVHFEEYSNPDDAGIKELYRATEKHPASQRFIEENSKPSLAHVFTEVRYKREDAEAFSKVYIDAIRKAGITL